MVRDAVRVPVLRVIAAAVVRIVLLTLAYVVYAEVVSRSESTDALGAGLLFFLIVVSVAFAWSTYDAARRGFLAAAVVWLLTAAGVGLTITVAYVVGEQTAGAFVDELREGWLFFSLLVFVPAVPGAGIGSLFHRSRRGGATS